MTTLLAILLLPLCLPLFAVGQPVQVGAECPDEYLPMLAGKRVAVMTNHTGMVGNEQLVDFLVGQGCALTAIFSPEHGFRGNAEAGAHVADSTDARTGVSVYSLYGKQHKPTARQMQTFDVLVADIQDVGLRFYTYYITLINLMEACAEAGKPLIVLDRPNPNGGCTDGPVLDMKYRSGVGRLPIPVLHGMTLGELALMANGEGWLSGGKRCRITVIRCRHYSHATLYDLPVPPSPNLPNMKSVYLYPSLCLFEGTVVSLGRGTPFPFQVYGHPDMRGYTFRFTPQPTPAALHPPLQGKTCYGRDLRSLPDEEIRAKGLDLTYVIDAYRNLKMGDRFFTPMFEKLVGAGYVRQMIEAGADADQIKARWLPEVEAFKARRQPYMLYE
jgi:uncharacterized protein YbbC (DUF1343 family)